MIVTEASRYHLLTVDPTNEPRTLDSLKSWIMGFGHIYILRYHGENRKPELLEFLCRRAPYELSGTDSSGTDPTEDERVILKETRLLKEQNRFFHLKHML